MSLLKKLFGSKTPKSVTKTIVSIEEFPTLNSQDRMGQIMFCGDSANPQYYPLLKYAILNDPDLDVKMAALKRIHLFAPHPDIIDMMDLAKSRINTKSVEPYYSMALSRLGVISIEEFKERLGNGFKI